MEGRTITRADLSESVFQEVGLSRNESSDLVETILSEVVEALARGESVQTAERRIEKSAQAFRTISEVASELDVPQHVLRFWESKFSQVRPLKRGGGRRYYRPEDIDLLRRIRTLLYEDGYTIKGVQ